DADVTEAARIAVHNIANNTGQVCSAATRVIIPSTMKKEFETAMKEETDKLTVDDPVQDNKIGPLVAEKQWDRVQAYIQKEMDEEATVLVGGKGNLEGLEKGYFAKPTVFTDVDKEMTMHKKKYL